MPISLLVLILVLFLTAKFESYYEDDLNKKNEEIANFNSEQLEKIRKKQEEDDLNKSTENSIVARGFGDVNLFQGIQIHIEGVNIYDKFFTRNENYNVKKIYGGDVFFDTDNFVIDPDKPKKGYPNLRGQIYQAQPFTHRSFFKRLFESDYSGPEFLEKILSKSSKVDSFYWTAGSNSILIEQHALQFAIDVNTQYNSKNDPDGPKVSTDKNVFGRPIDNGWEWDNKRYPPVHIVLSFKPSSPDYFTSLNINKPSFAVSAVELIGIKRYSSAQESEGDMGADSDLEIGKTLPLYSSLNDLPIDYDKREKKLYEVETKGLLSSYLSLKGADKNDILRSNLFGKEKYSVIRIANIGTKKEGNILVGSTKSSEAYRFIFALHMFVYGDWETKYTPVSKNWGDFQEKAQIKREDSLIDRSLSGLVDVFLPTLGLGGFGQFFVFIVLFLLLLPLFPALIQVITMIISIVKTILNLINRSA
jgi:hypothetical protein